MKCFIAMKIYVLLYLLSTWIDTNPKEDLLSSVEVRKAGVPRENDTDILLEYIKFVVRIIYSRD